MNVRLTLAIALCALTGCKDRSGSSESVGFRVERFSHESVTEVALNAALIFEFTEAIDPASVNSDTIQIRRVVDGAAREIADGTFEVAGAVVTWFPAMPSRSYPIRGGEAVLPEDAGLNAAGDGTTYSVALPSVPHPNTIRSRTGRGLRVAYESQFRTRAANVDDVERLFTRDAPYFRNTLRVADVLAYSVGAPTDWSPTLAENPLFAEPSRLSDAKRRWINRDNTGEWVDQAFGIRLEPRVPRARLADAALPTGRRDERLVSNVRGATAGRSMAVTTITVPFTQPLPPHTFNDPRIVQVEVAETPAGGEARTVGHTATFTNDPTASALVLTLDEPIRSGWLRITIDASAVRGMPGGELEPNCARGFSFVWPVRIAATDATTR